KKIACQDYAIELVVLQPKNRIAVVVGKSFLFEKIVVGNALAGQFSDWYHVAREGVAAAVCNSVASQILESVSRVIFSDDKNGSLRRVEIPFENCFDWVTAAMSYVGKSRNAAEVSQTALQFGDHFKLVG